MARLRECRVIYRSKPVGLGPDAEIVRDAIRQSPARTTRRSSGHLGTAVTVRFSVSDSAARHILNDGGDVVSGPTEGHVVRDHLFIPSGGSALHIGAGTGAMPPASRPRLNWSS
jgi:hypothetical protein